MKSRRRAREVALQILYRYDVEHAKGAVPATGAALAKELNGHFDHFQVPEPSREFSAELVAGTLQNLPGLDELIEKRSSNWKVARMASIDRSLLRMAVHEMRSFPEIPYKVTMDEAIELAKQFGTAETPAFVNGILDAVVKELPAKDASGG